LYALGIPGVGLHLARVLARNFKDVESLAAATQEELEAIREVGDKNASSIRGFFADDVTRKHVESLLERGVDPRNDHHGNDVEQTLRGVTIVVTGTLADFSRDEAKDAIESRGGRATSSVSSNTDFLVVGEHPGTKLAEAEEHSVAIIDEEEFKALLENGP
ncbi:MAG: helix-hairpin-helix domain-containing protein, partial [Spirochaetales bacterium]